MVTMEMQALMSSFELLACWMMTGTGTLRYRSCDAAMARGNT
jgi:hypothetical protein